MSKSYTPSIAMSRERNQAWKRGKNIRFYLFAWAISVVLPVPRACFDIKSSKAGLSTQFLIDSAGTHAYHIGEPPDLRSQEHALKRGIDLSAAARPPVASEDFERFDLLLAMDKENLALLQRKCPATSNINWTDDVLRQS